MDTIFQTPFWNVIFDSNSTDACSIDNMSKQSGSGVVKLAMIKYSDSYASQGLNGL